SVEYGIKFLQGMDNIFIDSERCPNAWREFSCYELEKDKSGEWKTRPPDKNNHIIDATSYSLNDDKGIYV
ncbi:MAG: terminase large subunit, partial [Candidatus Avelusimicrobium sp.]